MPNIELDLYELDLLCDACDSYIEEIQTMPGVIGAAERAELLREKLKMAAHEVAKQNTAIQP